MDSITQPLQLTPVLRTEIARYYLASEISNAINGDNLQVRPDLSEKELWRLLEAFSHTYRANGVFHFLTDDGFDWYQTDIPVERIAMTGMSPPLNQLIQSDEISSDPIKLRNYLHSYFQQHPREDDDPEQLNECRPRPVTPGMDIIIVREDDKGIIKMADGSHRFLSLLVDDRPTVTAYYAKQNGQPHKHMMGDTIFLTMRRLYTHAQDEVEKQAILATTRALMRSSHDWREAIQTYWIDCHTTDETTTAAHKLLDSET